VAARPSAGPDEARRHIDPELVCRVATTASEWGRPGASEVLLEHGAHLDRQSDDGAIDRWTGAVLRGEVATQIWAATEWQAVRSFGFGANGCTVAQVADAHVGWAWRVDALEQLVRKIGR
jgi:hypothetical protein